jgi:hypothetical protein
MAQAPETERRASSTPSRPSKDHKEVEGNAPTEIVHDEEKMKSTGVVGDYSGAAAKTDPAEIKLVRKLDRMIMVNIH